MLVKDAELIETKALPNGAANTSTDAFDLLGVAESGKQAFLANCEILISAPVLAVGAMSNGKTMIYSIESHDDSAFSGPTIVADQVLVQTGAGGVGCAAATARFRLPTNVARFVRVKATGSASGDASGSDMTVSLVF